MHQTSIANLLFFVSCVHVALVSATKTKPITSKQSSCKPVNDTTYSGFKTMLKPYNTSASPEEIDGEFKILDGCTFQISNFTLFPPVIETFFYAELNDGKQVRLVQSAVGGFKQYPYIKINVTKEDGWQNVRAVKLMSEYSLQVLSWFPMTTGSDQGTSKATSKATPNSSHHAQVNVGSVWLMLSLWLLFSF